MISHHLTLKKNTKGNQELYVDNDFVALIKDCLRWSIFFPTFKNNSYIEIEINQKKYIVKCIRSMRIDGLFAYFEIFSPRKKIGTFEVFTIFFLFNMTSKTYINRENGINYFEYKKSQNLSSLNVSYWKDENTSKVMIFKKNQVEFDESVFTNINEAYLIMAVTSSIEKIIFKKIKKLEVFAFLQVVFLTALILGGVMLFKL